MCLQGKFPANIVAQNQIEVRLKGPSQQQSRESISEMFLSDIVFWLLLLQRFLDQ